MPNGSLMTHSKMTIKDKKFNNTMNPIIIKIKGGNNFHLSNFAGPTRMINYQYMRNQNIIVLIFHKPKWYCLISEEEVSPLVSQITLFFFLSSCHLHYEIFPPQFGFLWPIKIRDWKNIVARLCNKFSP